MNIGRGQIRDALFNFFIVKKSLFCIFRMLPSVSKITPVKQMQDIFYNLDNTPQKKLLFLRH